MYDNTFNKLANVHNHYQGDYKRVLFCCSAGLLRSATAQAVFSGEPYNWNCRNAGVTREYALIDISLPLLEWADAIYVMENEHVDAIEAFMREPENIVRGGPTAESVLNKTFILNVPDQYPYRDPDLIKALEMAMKNPTPAVSDDLKAVRKAKAEVKETV